jgi:hypothetical protein
MRNYEEVKRIKGTFLPGMRVRLVEMDDVQAPPLGCMGTVKGVDDIGSVMVAWDNGSGLNALPGIDEIEIVGGGRR